MELTTQNTAIVLDSTSDFPDAQERYPNMRVVPLYVRFGDESLRDHVDITPEQFYERLAGPPSCRRPRSRRRRTSSTAYESLAPTSASGRSSSPRSFRAPSSRHRSRRPSCEGGDDRVRLVDSETASLACAMLALAIQRRLERGTTDEEIEQLVQRFKEVNRVVFTVAHAGVPAEGRPHRSRAGDGGTLLNVKPILSVADGVIAPVTKVRGRQKALEEFASMFTAATEDDPGLRVSIAHANAPEWVDVLTDLVERTRPQAEIELVRTLGAVVGTHAGPGAVGFFWFQDELTGQSRGAVTVRGGDVG